MGALRTRSLVEGALLAALTALLGLISFYVGLGFIQPVPVAVAALRHGPRTSLLAALVGCGLLALWVGPIAAGGTLGYDLALGVLFGWFALRTRSAGATLVGMTGGLLAAGVAGYLALLAIWHQNLLTMQLTALNSTLDTLATVLHRVAAASEAAALVAELRGLLVPTLLPLALLFSAVSSAVLVYVLTGAIGRRVGVQLPVTPPFADWRLPGWMAWVLVGLVASILLLKGSVVRHIALDGLIVLAVAYITVGIGRVYRMIQARLHLSRRRVGWLVIVGGIVGLAIFGGFLLIALAAVGLFAPLMDQMVSGRP